MEGLDLDLVVDPGWAIGLFLAQVRVAVFAVAAPQLSGVPGPGRLALVVALGLAMTAPVQVPATAAGLVALVVVNAVIGALLGFVVGIVFQLFAVAGSVIDVSAATSIAAVFDPLRNEQAAVFARIFQVTALTFFLVTGGLTLVVGTLGWSVDVVPLDGSLALPGGVMAVIIDLVSTLMVAGFELALPVIGALFLMELVLGLGARFAPTANIFLIGLPAKILVAMVLSTSSLVLFPTFHDGMLDTTRDAVVEVLNAFAD